jgi:hypothetical protein
MTQFSRTNRKAENIAKMTGFSSIFLKLTFLWKNTPDFQGVNNKVF